MRLVYNGAEPIAPALAADFMRAYAPYGLRASAMFPVYGLAEASLAVTFPAPGTGLTTIAVDRSSLGVGERVEPLTSGAPNALELAMVGSPVKGCEVQIADEGGYALPTLLSAGSGFAVATSVPGITATRHRRTRPLRKTAGSTPATSASFPAAS